jgi:hypothetical protein
MQWRLETISAARGGLACQQFRRFVKLIVEIPSSIQIFRRDQRHASRRCCCASGAQIRFIDVVLPPSLQRTAP